MHTDRARIVFLCRSSPYCNTAANAALDLLLTAAAFDQEVSLVFSDDGVFHLLKDQLGTRIGLKNIAGALPVLALYEVQQVLVEASSLAARNLEQDSLLMPVALIETPVLAELLEDADQVFNF
ncbi:MAG: sulfurtransferase complex subunit TusC [Pseudomonadales bacterium]|nr:sulfurtransferase complex subunit TusC [Pseudomonadales bacterium]